MCLASFCIFENGAAARLSRSSGPDYLSPASGAAGLPAAHFSSKRVACAPRWTAPQRPRLWPGLAGLPANPRSALPEAPVPRDSGRPGGHSGAPIRGLKGGPDPFTRLPERRARFSERPRPSPGHRTPPPGPPSPAEPSPWPPLPRVTPHRTTTCGSNLVGAAPSKQHLPPKTQSKPTPGWSG